MSALDDFVAIDGYLPANGAFFERGSLEHYALRYPLATLRENGLLETLLQKTVLRSKSDIRIRIFV